MYNYTNYNQANYTMPLGNQNNVPLPETNQIYKQNLTNSYDGFIRGNMFIDLYEPYITSEPFNLTPANDREVLLNKVRECNFAALDIGLYLDTHPEDSEKIKAFNQCVAQGEQQASEYEAKYGPLTLNSTTLNSYPWAWIMSPWPWEVR